MGEREKGDNRKHCFCLIYRELQKKKKYLTCKVPPLHRSFSVHRVYLFFHLICIMCFSFVSLTAMIPAFYIHLCVHIYMYFIYIYMYMCDLHFDQLVVWAGLCPACCCGYNTCGKIWGLLENRRAVRMSALSIFSELELSSLN